MKSLKYTRIRTVEQYDKYCMKLKELIERVHSDPPNNLEDEIDLLTILIEKWEEENSSFSHVTQVELLKFLMNEHNLKSKDVAEIACVSKGMMSSILNYRKGMSKTIIRKLAEYFKLSQSALNQPYRLQTSTSKDFKNAS